MSKNRTEPRRRGLTIVLVSCLVLAFASAATARGLRRVHLPNHHGLAPEIGAVINGSQHALWFADAEGYLGRLGSTGRLSEFRLRGPHGAYAAQQLATRSPDSFWLASGGSSLAYLNINTGALTQVSFPPLVSGTFVQSMTQGYDGSLWLALSDSQAVYRVASGAHYRSWTPDPGEVISNVSRGPGRRMWFQATPPASSRRPPAEGSIDKSGHRKLYPDRRGQLSSGIATGEHGSVWFVDDTGHMYAVHQAASGRRSRFKLPILSAVTGNTSSRDGSLWITVSEGTSLNAYVHVTATGKIRVFHLPDDINPGDIVLGPEGHVWFLEEVIGQSGSNVGLPVSDYLAEIPGS